MGYLRIAFSFLVLTLMVIVGGLFSLQNTTRVALDLLVIQSPEHTVSFWLLSALAIGAVFGFLAGSATLLFQRFHIAALRHQKNHLTKEVDRLRRSDSLAVND